MSGFAMGGVVGFILAPAANRLKNNPRVQWASGAPCDMRPDIRALATEPEKDKKHDPACKWRPTPEPAPPWHHAGAPHVTRENAQRAKDAGRGADRRCSGD
jgi:hypothetical protein